MGSIALQARVAESGLDAAAKTARAEPGWKLPLKQANDSAMAAGVFSAPCIVVDGEPFWGNDRKTLIKSVLARGRFWPCQRWPWARRRASATCSDVLLTCASQRHIVASCKAQAQTGAGYEGEGAGGWADGSCCGKSKG